jgi:NitT/TauT family transport system substrate-binding protein
MGGLGGTIDRALFVGEAKGFFDEQGVDLQTENFRSAVDMVPLLATGQLDAGHGGTNAGFFNAVLVGSPLRIVSDVSILRPPGPGVRNTYWLVLRQGLADEVRGVRDLRGRTVATNAIGAQSAVERVLAYHGMTLDEVRLETVAFPDQLVALSNAAIDAATSIEPFVTLGQERNVLVPLFDTGQALPDYPVQLLFYGDQFVRTQPDAGRRFMVAYTKALRYVEDAFQKGTNRGEVVQAFVDHTAIKDAALYERMAPTYNETNGRVNVAALDRDQDFYVAQGLQRAKVDLASLIDPSFGEFAVQVLGRY